MQGHWIIFSNFSQIVTRRAAPEKILAVSFQETHIGLLFKDIIVMLGAQADSGSFYLTGVIHILKFILMLSVILKEEGPLFIKAAHPEFDKVKCLALLVI